MATSNPTNGKGTILAKRVQAWGLVVGVILLIPLAYGVIYYQDRENYITSLYFRSLSDIDHQINKGLRGLDYLLDYALHESNPAFHDFCSNKYKKYCQEYKDYFAKYSNELRNIKFKFGQCNTDKCFKVEPTTGSSDKTLFKVSGAPDNRKITVFESVKISCGENTEDKKILEGQKSSENQGNPEQSKNAKAKEKPEKEPNSKNPCLKENGAKVEPEEIRREATVPLSDLIDPSPALKYFDEILLLDKGGNIQYRSGADDISKTGNFDALDDFARFENLSDYLHIDEEDQMDRSAKNGLSNGGNETASHSRVRDAKIGSIPYKLFIQPFHAVREQDSDSNEPEKERLAYLVGIVSEKKYIAKIVSLPIGRITIGLAGVLFIILLIPHLKLELSGPHFMPSRALGASLAVSLPLLVVLLTTGLFGTQDYWRLSGGLNDTASAIAERIEKNFQKEIEALRKLNLCEINTPVSKSILEGEINAKRLKAEPNSYPEYELRFYLNEGAKQTGAQYGYRQFPGAPVNVPRREYFKRPYYRPESLMTWSLSEENNDQDNSKYDSQPYYSERIQTYDQGMKLTAYSRPIPVKREKACAQIINVNEKEDSPKNVKKDEPKVEVMIKLMHTFFKPVLPMGFGFAVIEDLNGDVIYHSKDQRSLLENFFVETDQNDKLIAAVQLRQAQPIDGMYNGDPHGFYVTPLVNTPWSLIVFFDKSLMEIVHLKGWIYSIVLATSIVIMALIISFFLYPLISKRLEYFAPHGQFWISKRDQYPFVKSYFDYIYVMAATILLVPIFGVSSGVIYAIQYGKQMEQLSKLNVVHVGQQLLERKASLTHEFGRLAKTEGVDEIDSQKVTYLEEKLFNFAIYSDVHTQPDNNNYSNLERQAEPGEAWAVSYMDENACHHGNEDAPSTSSDFAQFIQDHLPPLSRLDAAHREMTHNKSSDDSWKFIDEKRNNIVTAKVKDPGELKPMMLTGWSDPSSKNAPKLFQSSLLTIYALLCLYLLYNLIKFTSQRLMGLRFPQRVEWRNYFARFQREPILMLAPGLPDCDGPSDAGLVAERSRIAQNNFETIASGKSEALLELKSILFNRSNKSLINFDNVEPLMWLILGGLFQYNRRGIHFESREMKKWVREQNWSKQIHDYEAASRTNLWRLLAPAFYATLLLAIGYLVLSGGHIGELIVSLLPVALAGGFPLASQLVEKLVRE